MHRDHLIIFRQSKAIDMDMNHIDNFDKVVSTFLPQELTVFTIHYTFVKFVKPYFRLTKLELDKR